MKAALASAIVCVPLALAGLWLRGTEVFLTHPLTVTVAGSAALYTLCIAALEVLGFTRLRELTSVILTGSPSTLSTGPAQPPHESPTDE